NASKRNFNGSSTCEQVLKGIDVTGKTIAITGTSKSPGIETARHLALAGARVICLNRNKKLSGKQTVAVRNENDKGYKNPSFEMFFIKCDLSSLASVRDAAVELMQKKEKLDVLILNAGLQLPAVKATSDGLETTFGVNHVGHSHLTNLLLPLLKSSSPARIVVVSSHAHLISGV
ncbi:hypothetical protein PFISCL1PPCAC_19075, partial [Pristionchus fissidentatus]